MPEIALHHAWYVRSVTSRLLPRHGGEVLASDVAPYRVEGEARTMNAIVRFPSREAALSFYADPDYQEAKRIRQASTAKVSMVLVEEFHGGSMFAEASRSCDSGCHCAGQTHFDGTPRIRDLVWHRRSGPPPEVGTPPLALRIIECFVAGNPDSPLIPTAAGRRPAAVQTHGARTFRKGAACPS